MKKFAIALLVMSIGIGGFVVGKSNSGQAVNQLTVTQSQEAADPDSILIAGEPTDPQAALAWSALMDPTGEYAALAMYTAVIEKFGQVEPYVSIREAEQKHIDALIRQLTNYGISVPENPYLESATAPSDLQAAATAWATGEVENAALYDQLLTKATDSNLVRVFTNLRRASLEMHLAMFEAAAQNGGQLSSDQMAQYMHG
ncbi:MAG: hypothetical protein RIS61_837 [Actinomycetota bacterium]|jgi:hypothetical protein